MTSSKKGKKQIDSISHTGINRPDANILIAVDNPQRSLLKTFLENIYFGMKWRLTLKRSKQIHVVKKILVTITGRHWYRSRLISRFYNCAINMMVTWVVQTAPWVSMSCRLNRSVITFMHTAFITSIPPLNAEAVCKSHQKGSRMTSKHWKSFVTRSSIFTEYAAATSFRLMYIKHDTF